MHDYKIDYSNIPYGPLPIEWRPVVGYEGIYEVSNYLEVKSLPRIIYYINTYGGLNKIKTRTTKERVVSNIKTSKGYWATTLNKNNKSYATSAHRVASIAFLPRIEGKNFINHKNSIRDDRMLGNLEWCTAQENSQHSWMREDISELRRKRASEANSILTKAEYEEILMLLNTGMYQHDIAKITNASRQLISLIKLGKSGYTSKYINY